MAEDEAGTIMEWSAWISRNLHGRVSVPRIQKRMREAGVDPAGADAMIADAARVKERSLRRTAARRLVVGLILLLIPIALTSLLLSIGRHPKGETLYCIVASAVAGVGLIGQGFWWRRRAAAFVDPLCGGR